jgi:hypothetical protein
MIKPKERNVRTGHSYEVYNYKKVSKNISAEEICGFRGPGNPLFYPGELQYACPICGEYGEKFHWSEYATFCWCEKCNLDIPSCLCVKYPEPHFKGEKPLTIRQQIKVAADVYLRSVKECVERHKSIVRMKTEVK